jgi:hypothetical protein
MALGRQVVDLVGLNVIQQPTQSVGVGDVAVVELKLRVAVVLIRAQVVDTLGVAGAGTPKEAVDLILLVEQKLGEIGSVLACDPVMRARFIVSPEG